MSPQPATGSQRAAVAGPALKRLLTVAVFTVVWAVILFVSAGTARWYRGWVYVAVSLACLLVNVAFVAKTNPAIIGERGKSHKDAIPADKLITAIYTILLFVLPVVAGLDAIRFAWSAMSLRTVYPGIALFVAGDLPILWSMMVNPFLETKVRIQSDRGHRTVTVGPYRFVRHPMYVGIILQTLAVPLVLGSWWSFLPAGLIVILFIVRTAFEDRTLRRALPGYEEYTHETPHRLVPGLW